MMAFFSHYAPLADISPRLSIPSLVFCVVTPLVVVIRFVARSTHGNQTGADDWTVLASLIFAQTVNVLMIICCGWGFGKHTKELPRPLVTKTLEMYFFAQILYKINIALTKISILLLYIRVFGPYRWFRILCWTMIAVVFAFAVATSTTSVFQCSPVEFAFNKKANGGHGSCIDLGAFWYATAGFNIGSDLIIIATPALVIKSLVLPTRSKVALCGVFALGGFVCVTSVLRFTTLNVATSHKDVMWQSINSSMWTVIESNLGIITASMPALRRPLAAIFPVLLGQAGGTNASSKQMFAHNVSRWGSKKSGTSTDGSHRTDSSSFSREKDWECDHQDDFGAQTTRIEFDPYHAYQHETKTGTQQASHRYTNDMSEISSSFYGQVSRGSSQEEIWPRPPSACHPAGITKTTEISVQPGSGRVSPWDSKRHNLSGIYPGYE